MDSQPSARPAQALVCPACEGPRTSAPVHVPDHEYAIPYVAAFVTCGECGSLFQSPMPDPAELSGFYPHDYHSMTGQGPVSRLRNDLRLRRILALTGPGGPGGPMLDYGCGNGDFLLRAARRWPGSELWGFEIAPEPAVRALAGGAVTIVNGDLGDLMEHLPPCRLITMNHVIEHLPDPFQVVSALRSRLAPGGLFEGQTPAADSWEHRVFGRRWSGYHAPRHTVVFTRAGLSRLLDRAGFVDVHVRGAFNPAGLAVTLGSLAHGAQGGRVRRGGPGWLALLCVATLLAPIDVASRAPAIVDFVAHTGED